MKGQGPDSVSSASNATGSNASSTSPAGTPFVRTIYELIQRGENKTALSQLIQHHERNANKSDLEYLIPYAALLIMERDSIGRAQKFLEQVLASKASNAVKAQAHHWLGYLLLDQEEGDMGLSHFLDSLQLNPKDPASRFQLGHAYLFQGKASQALDYFQLAELERPDLWLIHLHKALAREELNQLEEAKTSFQRAIAMAPDRWMSYMLYATFQKNNGDSEGAQATIRKMLTRDPKFEVNSPAPWGFYRDRVRYEKYLERFNEIMTRDAGEEKELGKLYLHYLMSQGQGGEGRKIETVAEKGGLMAKVFALKVVLDREASAGEIRTAANRLPPLLGDFGYYGYILRGEAKLRLGSYSEAESDFKRALEMEPQSALARFSLAVLLKRTQRSDEARTRMNELIASHPNYIPAILLHRTL